MGVRIIYGVVPGVNYKADTRDYVILIDPRKQYTDYIKYNKHIYDACSIKLLMPQNSVEQILLYKTAEAYKTVTVKDDTVSKELCFVTTLESIIKQYKIVSISRLEINMDIDNIVEILESIEKYSHIISLIITPRPINVSFLSHFDIVSSTMYVNKNVNEQLPKIEFVSSSLNTMTTTLQQYYKANIVTVNFIEKIAFHECIMKMLEPTLKHEFDIIGISVKNIDFVAPKIYYPISLNLIYINKTNDILYACQKTMHMLYNKLHDTEDYLLFIKNKPLQRIYGRKYFYEYLYQHFDIIEFTI